MGGGKCKVHPTPILPSPPPPMPLSGQGSDKRGYSEKKWWFPHYALPLHFHFQKTLRGNCSSLALCFTVHLTGILPSDSFFPAQKHLCPTLQLRDMVNVSFLPALKNGLVIITSERLMNHQQLRHHQEAILGWCSNKRSTQPCIFGGLYTILNCHGFP